MNEEEIARDRLLCQRNDGIYGAVQDLIRAMSVGDEPEWDMEIIGSIADFTEKALRDKGIPVCFPWEDEGETLCCYGTDACPHCIFKKE